MAFFTRSGVRYDASANRETPESIRSLETPTNTAEVPPPNRPVPTRMTPGERETHAHWLKNKDIIEAQVSLVAELATKYNLII